MSRRFKQKSQKSLKSLGMRRKQSVTLAVGFGLALIGHSATWAAPPHTPGNGGGAYYVQSSFNLPFQVKPGGRCPQQIDLIVSRDGGRTWQVHQTAAPAEGRFQFSQAEEGEYWLRVQVRDAGASSLSSSAMHLFVDRTAPVGTMQCQWEGDNILNLSCVVQDPNLDPDSLTLLVRTDTSGQSSMCPLQVTKRAEAQVEGCASIELPNCRSFEVRLTALDRAGNRLTAAERYFHPLLATKDDALLPPTDQTASATADGPATLELSSAEWGEIELGQPQSVTKAQLASTGGRNLVVIGNQAAASRPQELIPPAKAQSQNEPPSRQSLPVELAAQVTAAQSVVPSTVSASRQLKINYDLDQLPAGTDRQVELWATSDRGQTWEFWGYDRDATSPASVEVERDGEYGFCVVCIHSEADLQYRPAPGTAPDLMVTVKEPPKTIRLQPAARE